MGETMKHDQSATPGPSGVSRRTVVKGAAWAVPAIAVASSVPAMAASGPIIPRPAGNACKHPGEPKYYHFTFCFNNTSAQSITISLNYMVVNGITGPNTFPASVTVPAGTELCFYVDSGLYDNSANGLATLYFSYPYLGNTINGTVSTMANDLPPCGTGADPCDNPKENPPHVAGPVTPCVTTPAVPVP